jgi:hypothetical protein
MQTLTEREAELFLEKQELPVIKRAFARDLEHVLAYSREIGFPVVLKVSSSKILHKSEVHGVITNLKDERSIEEAYSQLSKIDGFEGVIVQQHIDGHELIIGLKQDQTFGHAIMLGFGGIYTEIFKDITFRICPIEKRDALQMIHELKSHKILEGVRGEHGIEIEKLALFLVNMSKLPLRYSKIKELDINPLFVNESQILIADARIIFD